MLSLRTARDVALRPLQLVLYLLSGLMRRDRKLWVFGAWHGERFSDNAAALLRFSVNHHEGEVRCVWVASRYSVVRRVRQHGLPAHHRWSPKGIGACLRGGVYVFVSTTRDINHWLSKGARLVLLRHGVGIKRIGKAHRNPSHPLYRLHHSPFWQRWIWRAILHWHTVPMDLVIATSKLHAEQALEYFHVSQKDVVITGFPRNDRLLAADTEDRAERQLPPEDAQLADWLAAAKAAARPVVFYMPTFRDAGNAPINFTWAELDARLDELGAEMLVRPHSSDRSNFVRPLIERRFAHLRLHHPQSDPHDVLSHMTALVTDYSSVAYDYMLLRRPIVFYTCDRDLYTSTRALAFDYDDVTPGLKATDLESLVAALTSIIDGTARIPIPAVDALLDQFHVYRDGQSAHRVFSVISARFATSATTQQDIPVPPADVIENPPCES